VRGRARDIRGLADWYVEASDRVAQWVGSTPPWLGSVLSAGQHPELGRWPYVNLLAVDIANKPALPFAKAMAYLAQSGSAPSVFR
jgi:hypothetical protein